jgi:gluconokinase
MRAGIPLTDADRLPWLHAIAAWMDEVISGGESAVLACSALKRSYRDLLRDGRPPVMIAYLDVPRAELERRLTLRHGHFFPERLLESQLAALQLPEGEEAAVTVPVSGGADETAGSVLAALRAAGRILGT